DLETFDNRSGSFSLVDGGTGDRAVFTGTGFVYQGAGGILAFDILLEEGTADLVRIEGDIDNETSGYIALTHLGDGGWAEYTPDIRLVEVTGETAEGDFVLLGGSFRRGFFDYDLALRSDDGSGESHWTLVSTTTEHVEEMPRIQGAIGQIWSASATSWSDHAAALRDENGRDQMAAADPRVADLIVAESAAAGAGTRGAIWGRVIGSGI